MKNITTKIILSTIIFLSVIGFSGTVNATTSSLYISPASLTKNAGDVFSASVGFNASSNNVCAVEGTLVFNNLSCQSITVSSDLMPQTSPTCSNPHFLIGIPNCTTSNKNLLTVSVKSGSAGSATINVLGVDIIGEGASVGSTSTSGNYTVNAVQVQSAKTTQKVTTAPKAQVKTVEQTTEATDAVETNLEVNTNQTAALGTTPAAYNFFGWLWANIIWIIVLIIASGISYITGRMSCKR